MAIQTTILVVALIYLLIVLGIGEYARRRTTFDVEDYFMASRSFGTLVLLFALLATNMSAFILVGIPGFVFSLGIGAYGWGSVFFLTFPVVFATVGYRLWLTGKKFGHVTPGDLFDHRYDADHLGTFVMLLMTFWTIPYIVAGAQGAGELFQNLAGVPYWAGALLVVLVVFVYVNIGGMRGTAWTNTFQGVVMIIFVWALLVALAVEFGGFIAASAETMAVNPDLASRPGTSPPGLFTAEYYFSWVIIFGINTLMNPHMFQRILPGFNVETLKRVAVLYPIGLMLVWIPPNIIGFWGAGQMPDLANPDALLPAIVGANFGPLVAGLAMAGILAALMSTMDGQSLSISNLFERDLVGTYTDLSADTEVWLARIFVGVVLLLAYIMAILRLQTIVGISVIAFEGYALMFLPLMIGFYWRRANEAAAWAGLIVGFLGFWAFEIDQLTAISGLPDAWKFGFTAIVPLMIVQIIVIAIVPYFTEQPPAERVNEYFDLFDGIW